MSFFEDPPPVEFEPEPEPEWVEPPWFGPPTGVIPGVAATQIILARTDRVVVMIDQFRAYPSGLTFGFNLLLRQPQVNLHHMPWEPELGPSGERDPDTLRWGLQLADGAKWTNVGLGFPAHDQEPEPPVVMGRGGGGGGREWQGDFWLWPLPPPGPLTFAISWPALDVPEQRAVIEAGPLRDAAASAETVWPD